jgi:pimeloyl-ACP methyl ester carboxylesterase
MILFSESLLAHLPLATKDILLNPKLNVPICIIYGDDDWLTEVEEDAPQKIVKMNKNRKLVTLPQAGHYLMFDNPIGLFNIISNECLGTNLPICKDSTRRFNHI